MDLRAGTPPPPLARRLRLAEHLAAAIRGDAQDRARDGRARAARRSTGRRSPPPPTFRPPPPDDDETTTRAGRSRRSSVASSAIRSDAQTRVVTSYGSRYDRAARRAGSRSATRGSSASTEDPGTRLGERSREVRDRVAGDRRSRPRRASTCARRRARTTSSSRWSRPRTRRRRDRARRAPLRAHDPAQAAVAQSRRA